LGLKDRELMLRPFGNGQRAVEIKMACGLLAAFAGSLTSQWGISAAFRLTPGLAWPLGKAALGLEIHV
jgi:hypothetical protein